MFLKQGYDIRSQSFQINNETFTVDIEDEIGLDNKLKIRLLLLMDRYLRIAWKIPADKVKKGWYNGRSVVTCLKDLRPFRWLLYGLRGGRIINRPYAKSL